MDQTPNRENNRLHQVLCLLININKQDKESLPSTVAQQVREQIQRQTPSQQYSQQLLIPINRAPMLPYQAQRVTPIQEQAIQNFGSHPQNSTIIQSQKIYLNSTLDKEATAQDCEDRLRLLIVHIEEKLNLYAVTKVREMIIDYKQRALIVREEDLDINTIEHLKEALNKYENSLVSISFRLFLSQMLQSFEFQNREKEAMSAKALYDLSSRNWHYGVDLLVYFFKPTQEWLNALKGQCYQSVPEEILNHMLVATDSLEFVIETLLTTRTLTFSMKLINQLMDNIKSLLDEAEIIRSVRWVIRLCRKFDGGRRYAKEFIKQEIFYHLAQIYYSLKNKKDIQDEIMTRMTQLVWRMVERKITPDFVRDLSESGFFQIYDFDVEMTAEGYSLLHLLVTSISDNYPEQLKICLRWSQWYQKMLLMLIQSNERYLAKQATLKLKSLLATDWRQISFLLWRIRDPELRQMLGLL